MGDSEETQARYFAKNRHVGRAGAGSTRRPGRAGRLVDQVTGIGSPALRLVKLEVKLGLGDRIGQLECLGFGLPGGRPGWAPGGRSNIGHPYNKYNP